MKAKLIGFLLMVSYCLSCVDQIDFRADQDLGTLVVDGAITTNSGPYKLRLSRSDVLGKRVFQGVTNAVITAFDDTGLNEPYKEIGDGLYELPGLILKGQVGRSYYITISLPNGGSYQSIPEEIFPSVAIDRVRYDVEIRPVTIDQNKRVDRAVLNVYCESSLLDDPSTVYLRYKVDHSFLVSELLCSPLQPLQNCYVSRNVQMNGITLLDGSRLGEGAQVSREVASVEVDHAFGEAAVFYVRQQSLSIRSYDYWFSINQIINNVGSVFDAPPAGVVGNIIGGSDQEEVLGFFGAYDETAVSLRISRGDLPEEYRQQPFCGLPGFPPSPLDAACCNCLRLENSTLVKPVYWP